MSKAFGSGRELPVDMEGNGWPIDYHLTEEQYNDEAYREAEKENLIEKLVDEIRKCFWKDSIYQRRIWAPLKVGDNWGHIGFDKTYFVPNSLEQLLLKARDIIGNTNQLRIVGPTRSGRTRFLFELFRGNTARLIDKVEIINKVIYADLGSITFERLIEKLIELDIRGQKKILIVDNCAQNIHGKLYNEHLHNTETKLITFGEENEVGDIKLTDQVVHEVIVTAINSKYQGAVSAFAITQANGSITEALKLLELPLTEESIQSFSDEIKWLGLLPQVLLSKGALEVMQCLSLFSKVGYRGYHQINSGFILKHVPKLDQDKLMSLLMDLNSLGYIELKGDFAMVLPDDQEGLQKLYFTRLNEERTITMLQDVAEFKLSSELARSLKNMAV
jgi:hypothetical protein